MVIYLAESPEPQYIAQKAQVILATVTTSMLVPMIIAVKEERNLRPTDVREASIKQQLFATLGPLQLPISIVFQHHGFATEFKNTLKRITAQNDLPKIAIKQLELTNIGVYKQLTVEFEQQIAVLIGLNGAGKSTILKAIALAILGVELSGYDSDDFGSLLRIIGKEDTQTLWQPQGEITLTVHIDGNLFSNSIKIEYDNIKEKVVAHGRRFEPLIDDENQPLTLILGISEQRNIQSKATRLDMPTVTLPKPKDLLPLLDNNEQTCIAHFESWLANLAYKVSQGELQLRPQINISFAVFSALMDEIITFAGLTSVDPVKLWIDHQDPKQTVPLRLASQGYQAVMGWVGSIIQRMFEAYGNTLQPLHCPAIILIDEIDQLLHVKWQQRILNVLANEFFPNTQWIITTHSPMVVTGLNEHQVIQLRKEQDKLIAEPNAVDLWMWQYGDIVSRLFEVMPEPPQANIDYLEQQIEQLAQSPYKNQSQLTKLNDRLARAIKSREQADELFRESQKLRKQQDTLATLIKQLNQPKDSDK
jgi:energy-coupling factor transporter ATP-binding protein EcfA2